MEGCYIIFFPRSNQSGRYTLELFTTAASGLSHPKSGNVGRALVLRLLPAGVGGGCSERTC
jgi:hypothetical protein